METRYLNSPKVAAVPQGNFWADLFLVLKTPSCWLQNNGYSPIWDRKFRELLAEHSFKKTSNYTADLGGICVWVANHPYASFSPYGKDHADVRPSRSTILRAHDKLMSDRWS